MRLTTYERKTRYDAQRKRKSRAKKTSAYHDRERELSRQRMALGRAREKAQKRASQLRSILDEADKQVFEARADKEKQRLICDWFRRKLAATEEDLRYFPLHVKYDILNNVMPRIDNDILNTYMPKLDLHKIELQVAQFEISMMMTGVGEDNDVEKNLASGLEKETEISTSARRTVLETTGVQETTGTPSTTGGDSGKDAFAASLLLGLPGAKDDRTAAIAPVREAPPVAAGDSDEGASRPEPVAAMGNDDDGTAARHTVSPSLGTLDGTLAAAGAAPVAFLLQQGWRSAIDPGSGRVYYYRHLPGRCDPSVLGDGVLPPRGGVETSGDIGTCEANDASIPDSQMSSHA